MKKILLSIFLCFPILILVGCDISLKREVAAEFSCYLDVDDGKGIEAYCWQNDQDWRFGLLPGTNRHKTGQEINNLKPASFEQMKYIVSTYTKEQRKNMSLSVVERPATDTHYEYSSAYEANHPEIVDGLIYDLGIANFTKTRWQEAEDKRAIFKSFLEEKSINNNYSQHSTRIFDYWLGEPNKKEEIVLETSPTQYGGMKYIYNLYRESEAKCHVALITFDRSNILTDISYTTMRDSTYYSFGDLFPWVATLNKDNLKGIKIEDGSIGVNPETATPTTRYSEDERDLAYNLNILKNEPLKKTEYDLVGGYYRLVTYYLVDDTSYSIRIDNGKVLWETPYSYQYFRFDSTPTSLPDVFYPTE